MARSVCMQLGDIVLTVDYWTELLGAVSILCEDQDAICDAGRERCNKQYREDVLAYFQAFRGADVTRRLEQLSDNYNFNYDAPVALVLQLGHGHPIDQEELCRFRKPVPPPVWDGFLNVLRQFEQESGFAAFYDAHRAQYEQVLRHFMADYLRYDPLQFLKDYLQVQTPQTYHINLMMGITNSNYGVTLGRDLYANVCPNHRTRYAPLPDFSYQPIYWTTLIVHEFAHAFVNPITRAHSAAIAAIDRAPYRAILQGLMYGEDMETYVSETVIRAIECLYVQKVFPDRHEDYVQEYLDEDYMHVQAVERLLLTRQGDTLCDCYPDILSLF